MIYVPFTKLFFCRRSYLADLRLAGSLILLRCANFEIVAGRTADVPFPLFPAVPLGLTGPIDLACFTTVHNFSSYKIRHIDIFVNIIAR